MSEVAKIDLIEDTKAQDENPHLVSWLDRLRTSMNTAIRQTRSWINKHVFLEPPFLEHPHPQYWHKIIDAAWMHMYFQDFDTPKTVLNGAIITNWTGNIISDWQLVSDLAAGTVVILEADPYPATGTYFVSFSGYIEGTQNTNYIVTMYANGVPTLARMPIVLKGNATNTPVSWAGLVHIPVNATLTVVLEFGVSLDFYTLNWCLHRINPIAGTVGTLGVIVSDAHPPPPPVGGWDPGPPPP